MTAPVSGTSGLATTGVDVSRQVAFAVMCVALGLMCVVERRRRLT